MDENRRPLDPTQPGPVALDQLELNRELARRSPGATREQVQEQQDALQRDRPDAPQEPPASPEQGAQPGTGEPREPAGTLR